MKSKSKCRTCGEKIIDTGNYQVKILKSKRVPKKLKKLIQSGLLQDEIKKDILNQSKFGRFLLKRANPSNVVEITCGKCSSSSQIRTRKPMIKIKKPSDFQTPSSTTEKFKTDDSSDSSRKKRRKRNKELNAGLVIPTTPSQESTDKTDTPESYIFQSELPNNSTPSISTRSNLPKAKTIANTEKDMQNLRKVLFKSKKRGQNQGTKTSLKDFLSSM